MNAVHQPFFRDYELNKLTFFNRWKICREVQLHDIWKLYELQKGQRKEAVWSGSSYSWSKGSLSERDEAWQKLWGAREESLVLAFPTHWVWHPTSQTQLVPAFKGVCMISVQGPHSKSVQRACGWCKWRIGQHTERQPFPPKTSGIDGGLGKLRDLEWNQYYLIVRV